MPQTNEGAMKVLAAKIGIHVDEYKRHRDAGEKWCFKCLSWKSVDQFGKDSSRYDGKTVYCGIHRRVQVKKPWQLHVNPLTGRPGPAPKAPKSGDKIQARQRINVEVREGRRPHPNTLPCVDCKHVWKEGERRHEYDHYKGYAAENHYEVEAVCSTCHAGRSLKRGEMVREHSRDMASFNLEILYKSRTIDEIQSVTGIPAETIRRWLKAKGIPLRKRGEKPNG